MKLIESVPYIKEFVEWDSYGFIDFSEKLIALIVDEDSAKMAYRYIAGNGHCGIVLYHPMVLSESEKTIKQAFRVF